MPAGCCHNEQVTITQTGLTITRQTKHRAVLSKPQSERKREREAGGHATIKKEVTDGQESGTPTAIIGTGTDYRTSLMQSTSRQQIFIYKYALVS